MIENTNLDDYIDDVRKSEDQAIEDIRAFFLKAIDQSVDSHIQDAMRSAIKTEGNDYALAIIDLLAEYGIYGRKALDFANKLQEIEKKFGGKKE